MSRRRRSTSQVAFGKQDDLRRVVDETVNRARPYAIEVGDARFVDRTFETRQRTLSTGGYGHRITGFKQSFDAGSRFLSTAAEFPRIDRIKLKVTLPRGIHAKTGELPYVMTREDQGCDGFFEIVEIRLIEGDRGSGSVPGSGDMPTCREEFIGRLR